MTNVFFSDLARMIIRTAMEINNAHIQATRGKCESMSYWRTTETRGAREEDADENEI